MRKRSVLKCTLVIALAAIFICTGVYALDVIELDTKGYKKLTRPKVKFSHTKHSQDYAKANPDIFKNGCGECHHDENNKPLKNLKENDKVQSCIACHKEPGRKPSKEKLSKKEKIKKYHAEATHENCSGCHQSYNKAKKLKSKDKGYAPTKAKCKVCHAK